MQFEPLSPYRDDLLLGKGVTDVGLASLELGDPRLEPDVLFLHANGFNADAYRSALDRHKAASGEQIRRRLYLRGIRHPMARPYAIES